MQLFLNIQVKSVPAAQRVIMSYRRQLKTSPALAPKLKVKLRFVTVTFLSLAVLVAFRVFTLGNFGTPFAGKAAIVKHPAKQAPVVPDTFGVKSLLPVK